MAASASERLCTLDDVRALMQKKESDTTQNGLIESFIPRASTAAMHFCERQFAPVEKGVVKTFEWAWEGQFVSLAPYDATKINKVTIDTDWPPTPGVELSGEEWRPWPQPQRDGTIMALRLQPLSGVFGRVAWRNRQVQVEGDWGFPSVPEDVTHAVAATCVHWVSVNTAVQRRPDDDPNLAAVPRRSIPPEAYDLLSRYKRPVVV